VALPNGTYASEIVGYGNSPAPIAYGNSTANRPLIATIRMSRTRLSVASSALRFPAAKRSLNRSSEAAEIRLNWLEWLAFGELPLSIARCVLGFLPPIVSTPGSSSTTVRFVPAKRKPREAARQGPRGVYQTFLFRNVWTRRRLIGRRTFTSFSSFQG